MIGLEKTILWISCRTVYLDNRQLVQWKEYQILLDLTIVSSNKKIVKIFGVKLKNSFYI